MLCDNTLILVYQSLSNIFSSTIITGEPMHTTSEQLYRTLHLCICRLKRRCFVANYVEPLNINSCLKRISAIKVATTKITDDLLYEWNPSYAYYKSTFFMVSQRHKGGHW